MIANFINGLLLSLMTGIFAISSDAYKLFLQLSSGSIVSPDIYKIIVENFYIVIGVMMLFFISFLILKGIVNPDEMSKGTEATKKIVINLVTSAALIALLPILFTFLYDFQTSFINDQNVIGRFFGYDTTSTVTNRTNDSLERGTNNIVATVFHAFVKCKNDNGDCSEKLKEAQKTAIKHGTFDGYTSMDRDLEINLIGGILGGLFLVYISVSFCFDMASRLVRLIFYQIIAPIPIIFRIMPDNNLSSMFGKWLKVTLTCYFEVYIRIFTIYLVVWIINNLGPGKLPLWGNVGPIGGALIIMGIVMFMKQAPKLISEVTGIDSGNMKLGIREKLKDGGFFTAGAAVGGGVMAMANNAVNAFGNRRNWQDENGNINARSIARNLFRGVGSSIAGTTSGMYRGGRSGWNASNINEMRTGSRTGTAQAIQARNTRRERNEGYRANNQTPFEGALNNIGERFRAAIGLDRGLEVLNNESAFYNQIISIDDNSDSAAVELMNRDVISTSDHVMNAASHIDIQNPQNNRIYTASMSVMRERVDTYSKINNFQDFLNNNGGNNTVQDLFGQNVVIQNMDDLIAYRARIKTQLGQAERDLKDYIKRQGYDPNGVATINGQLALDGNGQTLGGGDLQRMQKLNSYARNAADLVAQNQNAVRALNHNLDNDPLAPNSHNVQAINGYQDMDNLTNDAKARNIRISDEIEIRQREEARRHPGNNNNN